MITCSYRSIVIFCCLLLAFTQTSTAQSARTVTDFDADWRFYLGDAPTASQPQFNDAGWRQLNLPHDWSIEGKFDKDNPAQPEGGALPGGIGWYRKTFQMNNILSGQQVYIDFDGVYQKSEVWINNHRLGMRPNGYISFRYDLTPWLQQGKNVIAVRVDNSAQPNSRWYSGSGIYRNVWLVTTQSIAVNHWGSYVTTPKVSSALATVKLKLNISNKTGSATAVQVRTVIKNAAGAAVASGSIAELNLTDSVTEATQFFTINRPKLWSVDKPYLYTAVTRVYQNQKLIDEYTIPLGIRYFNFDADKGFSLNGQPLKILGVCNHHDLGSLGAAINTRALERQLQLLKAMGCNAIRTSHNPPAPELLDLCDRMGFIVMDEAFDCWQKPKEKYDYHLYFKEWHRQDLVDQLLRDRNHPSVMMWSIGNEILEQWDSTGTALARELTGIVRQYDDRPVTDANNNPSPGNYIIKSGAMDLIGYNYAHRQYAKFQTTFPGMKFIGTETISALETRGVYDMPSDSIRRWPNNNEYKNGVGKMNDDYTVSAYDNVSAKWGSTHEETWKEIKKYDFLSGMFIWTGFDYLGEPTPYRWPARSSYFGIIDLAGFPKDVYYMYQSEWTNKPVLHLVPHWNWKPGQTIDVWAYYNQADEVELYLNGRSLGIRKKQGDDLHVMWRITFEPGTLRAVSRRNGRTVLTQEVHTAGAPARIELVADRSLLKADGKDLSFVTVRVLDAAGNVVPNADNRINFSLSGDAVLAGVDNGDPISHDPFKADYRKAFHGLALAIVQPKGNKGVVKLTATGEGLQPATVVLQVK
ncbi:beta-galactosidase GalB [Mucilaginibacter koreensis]